MRKIHITRLATAVGLSGALAITSAFAADSKKAAPQPVTAGVTDPASLPKFANARMINMAVPIATSSTQSLWMRAYVDPTTGELRGPTQEDLAKGAAAKSAKAAPAAARRSAVAAVAAPAVTVKANGARSAVLDEKFLSYSVVHVMPDGSISQECVDGLANAEKAMKAAATVMGVDRHEK